MAKTVSGAKQDADHLFLGVVPKRPFDRPEVSRRQRAAALRKVLVHKSCHIRCPFVHRQAGHGSNLILDEAEGTVDDLIRTEGLVQCSGTEPSLHPQVEELLRLATHRPIRRVRLNAIRRLDSPTPDLRSAPAKAGSALGTIRSCCRGSSVVTVPKPT